jgi:hypothetical protein
MAKIPPLPPATLGKPSKKSKYSEEEDDDAEDEGECGCGGHEEEGIMLKISILLPDSLQRKG